MNACYVLGCSRDNLSMTYLFVFVQLLCVRSERSENLVEIKALKNALETLFFPGTYLLSSSIEKSFYGVSVKWRGQ